MSLQFGWIARSSEVIITKLQEGELLKNGAVWSSLDEDRVMGGSAPSGIVHKKKPFTAWRHLRVSDSDLAAIEEKVEEQHHQKRLLCQYRKGVVPEGAPVAAETQIESALLNEAQDDWPTLNMRTTTRNSSRFHQRTITRRTPWGAIGSTSSRRTIRGTRSLNRMTETLRALRILSGTRPPK